MRQGQEYLAIYLTQLGRDQPTRFYGRSLLVRRFHNGILMTSSMMTLLSWLDKNKSNASLLISVCLYVIVHFFFSPSDLLIQLHYTEFTFFFFFNIFSFVFMRNSLHFIGYNWIIPTWQSGVCLVTPWLLVNFSIRKGYCLAYSRLWYSMGAGRPVLRLVLSRFLKEEKDIWCSWSSLYLLNLYIS